MSHADGDVLPVFDLRLQLRDLADQLLRPLHALLPRFPRRHRVSRSLDGDDVAGVLDGDGREGLIPSLWGDARGEGVAALVGRSR